MKTILTIILITLLLICFPSILISQEKQIYKHPSLKFQFEASQGWSQITHPEDTLIYEMISPDSNIHVILWYTETEQRAQKYLEKMAAMKELTVEDKPSMRHINNLECWVLNFSGHEQKISVQTLLAVFSSGRSQIHPEENRLFIIQIWCPKGKYEKHHKKMEEILTSVQLAK